MRDIILVVLVIYVLFLEMRVEMAEERIKEVQRVNIELEEKFKVV